LKTGATSLSVTNYFDIGADGTGEVVKVSDNHTWHKYLSSTALTPGSNGDLRLAEQIKKWDGFGADLSEGSGNINENPAIYPDMIVGVATGNVFVVWESHDGLGNYSIMVHKVDANGISWGSPVLVVFGNRQAQNPVAVSDNDGGLIIAWEDTRDLVNPGTGIDIYAKRIDSTGNNVWDPNGVLVTAEMSDQIKPQLVGDSQGGAIISWKDYADMKVYAQRVSGDPSCSGIGPYLCWDNGQDSEGNWNGSMITNYYSDFDTVPMISDGNGGAVIAWVDNNHPDSQAHNGGDFYNVYVETIDIDGNSQWIPGRGIKATAQLSGSGTSQTFPRITTDGNGGVIVFWKRVDKLYAQKINPNECALNSNRCWGDNGVEVSNHNPITSYSDTYNNFKVVDDDNSGAVVVWQSNNAAMDNDVYAQKVDMNGNIAWNSGSALPIAVLGGNQDRSTINRDALSGDFYIAWSDDRSGSAKVYAQKVLADDTIGYQDEVSGDAILNGIELNFDKTSAEISPYVAYTGTGGNTMVAYADNGVSPFDVYVQKVGANTFSPEGRLTSSIYDFGDTVNWGSITIDANIVPVADPNAAISFETSSNNGDPSVLDDWSPWSSPPPPNDKFTEGSSGVFPISSPAGRYIQYRLTFARGSTPILSSVILSGSLPSSVPPPVYSPEELGETMPETPAQEIGEQVIAPLICSNTLAEIQATPIPSFDPIWGKNYHPWDDSVKWAYDHRANIYNEYVSLLNREPCATEVNWWLQNDPDIFSIRFKILISEEYLGKQK